MLHSHLLIFLVFLASVSLSATAPGHTDISETIKALTAQLEEAPSADLYFQRATEFRALRETQHAIDDLESALQLQPHHRLAITSLIEMSGPSEKGLSLIKRYSKFAEDPAQQFEATYLLAEYYAQAGLAPAALILCEGLQKLRPHQDPALDLLHAQVLLTLGDAKKSALTLKAAWERTNSIVLRNNWIDTALTAGLTAEVLPIIEDELANSRFLSSWLIRRARAALIHGDKAQAEKDLRIALSEISSRIRSEQPDLTLITDRGLIFALLGDLPQARAHLAQLKNSNLPPASYRLLSTHLD